MNMPVACHECDLIQTITDVPVGSVARCSRCGSILYRHKPDSLNRSLAFATTGLILFLISNAFPFLAFKIEAQIHETILITGIWTLYDQGLRAVALLVFATIIVIPLFQMTGLLYLLVPLKIGRLPKGLPPLFRWLLALQPWSMLEVFMLGILVAMVKLTKMATIIPGTAVFSFLALIFVIAAMTASLDPHLVWEKWGELQ